MQHKPLFWEYGHQPRKIVGMGGFRSIFGRALSRLRGALQEGLQLGVVREKLGVVRKFNVVRAYKPAS
jgi:hypothetical protein